MVLAVRMESLRLRDYLPSLYGSLLPSLFDESVPRETRATCDDCVMCQPQPDLPKELELKTFRPDTKCCTYHPNLPNYLVGAILASDDAPMAEGRKRIREKIARGVGVTPRGILVPRKYALFYDQASQFFGRTDAMKCPYYYEGGCSVWRYREGVCTTFFCKYERGETSKRFWESLKSYLALVEFKLSLYAAAELEKDPVRVTAWWDAWDGKGPLTVADLEDRAPTESERRATWGEWFGREEAFYLACYEKVAALDAAKFQSLLGIEESYLRQRLGFTRDGASRADIPRRLKRNPDLCAIRRGDSYVCANPLNRGDAFEVHALIYPLLDRFDGERDAMSVWRDIAVEKRLDLPSDLLKKLYYLGVLVEA
jgi:hypothetical protein